MTLPLVVATVFLILLVVIRLTEKGPRMLRMGLYIILSIGIIEFAIFRNPVCLHFFWHRMSVTQMGWKQRDSIRLDLTQREEAWKKRYIAVGSSQAHATFNRASIDNKELGIVHTAGMTPVEIWWYRDIIKKHCDDTVILYLSEMDLIRSLRTSSFLISPQRDQSDLTELSRLFMEKQTADHSEIAELWISNYFATYRYSFLANGLIKKTAETIGGKNAILEPDETVWDNDAVGFLIKRTKKTGDDWITTNTKALDQFLAWSNTNDLKVVILQGQYHPKAQHQLRDLRNQAAELLKSISEKYENTVFVSQDEIEPFAAEDFTDPTHVSAEAGEKFTKRFLNYLDKKQAH